MTPTMLPSPPYEMSHSPPSKRKRSDIDAEEQGNQTFTATNLVTESPWTFEPVSRLLRAHLPLSWLVPHASNSPTNISPGSLLQGHITNSAGWDYAVLVARHMPNGGLVVFEKIETTYFVVYPLQPFVSEKWIQDASIGASPSTSLQMMLHYLPNPETDTKADSRRTPCPTSEPALSISKNRRGAAARLSILSFSEKTEDIIQSPRGDGSSMWTKNAAPSVPPEESEDALVTADSEIHTTPAEGHSTISAQLQTDMLSPAYLRQRYLDHLYMTKTSLAYYTKGPLSRARARARAQDSSMTLTDLAVFYRESLLPIKRMDLKYKESIQQVIRTTEPLAIENAKKSTRKTKLGKDGLWPIEHDFVLRWWRAGSFGPSISHNHQTREVRDAISSLRMREAQMQMILMLETLSIDEKQKNAMPEPKPLPESVDIKAESVEQDVVPEANKTKQKKQRNLVADLELLADRLCIWHSIGLEGSIVPTQDASRNDGEDQTESKDRLRNFCVDVLIPFYSSRLPLLCKSLCKTLAGPEVLEQAQKASRLKDASKAMAPGAMVKRRVSSVTGKEIERVVSEEGFRQPSPPALARSSTLPPLPKFKRETSELTQRPPSRSSRQPSVNFVNREIDLVADAQATASKKRKLDRVASHKQDLAAAIEALKKPNRRNVSSAYMDEVEKRKPEIRPDSVQITATPKVSRRTRLDDIGLEPLVQPVFGSDQAVLSSGVKPNNSGLFDITSRSSSKKKAVLAAIHDTPSRSAHRKTDPLQVSAGLTADAAPDGAAEVNYAHVLSTPSKPRSNKTSLSITVSTRRLSGHREQANTFELPDVALRAMDRAMKMPITSTIYDTLGWNDDDDDVV